MIYLSSDPKGWYVAYFGRRGNMKFDYWRSRTMEYGRAVNLKFRIERAVKRAGIRAAREIAKALPG